MDNENLKEACELTLLFYNVGPWTDAKKFRWAKITEKLLSESREATTKTLCDCVRKALEVA